MPSSKPKKLSPTNLRYAEALREAEFAVTQVCEEWLIQGYGKAALGGNIRGTVKKLVNKLSWRGDEVGAQRLYDVMHKYEQGIFHE